MRIFIYVITIGVVENVFPGFFSKDMSFFMALFFGVCFMLSLLADIQDTRSRK